MSLSNDYMLVLDEIRTAKKVSIADLTQDIITERTYYRMMKSPQVRTDIFSKLASKLGVDFSEFIHYAVFVKKSDSRFKFIYRVHTKFYRDIEEHYQAMKVYQDPSEELDLLIKVYIKKYEYERKMINQTEYFQLLEELIPKIKANPSFNIYLFTIQLIIKKDLASCHEFQLKQMSESLHHEEFSYSVILVAICYDLLLEMLMESQSEDESLMMLLQKYETLITYFPSRYFLMRYNLYKAYSGLMNHHEDTLETYLYKYIMNALAMVEEDEYKKQMIQINRVFKINITEFLYRVTKSKLY